MEWLKQHGMQLTAPLAVLAATLALGWAGKRVLFGRLRAWKTPHAVVQAFEGPFMIWVLMLALYLAAEFSKLPRWAAARLGQALLALWILSLTLMFARLARDLVRMYGSAAPGTLPVTSLTQNLAQAVVLVLGGFALMHQFGLSLAPLLTMLGVTGLAVALALQDTLSNLIGGIFIAMAGQVRLGDYIKLASGEEGYVSDIKWRSTTIRALANNLIVIPNAKLAQSVVTNYHLPEKRLAVSVPVTVGYDADPEAVERALLEVAAQPGISGLLSAPAPAVRLIPGFADAGLTFTLQCHVAEFADQFPMQHEVRKLIVKRFRAEGIAFAQPVYYREPPGKVTAEV